jgi:large subunit ribosomal protein L27
MAHTKSQGKTNQKSNRPGQRRGVKKFGDQKVKNGDILVRQVGTKFHPGKGVRLGKDFTIYSVIQGVVKFTNKYGKKIVNVIRI